MILFRAAERLDFIEKVAQPLQRLIDILNGVGIGDSDKSLSERSKGRTGENGNVVLI